MNRFFLLAGATVFAIGVAAPRVAADPSIEAATSSRSTTRGASELVICHFNDIHGFIFGLPTDGRTCGGLARLATALERSRAQARLRGASSLFMFAGDMFSGTSVVGRTQGECMVRLFNDLGLNVACLGNHEFSYGPQVLAKRLGEARYPVVDSNVRTTHEVGKLIHRTAVLDAGNLKVGFVGALTLTTPIGTFPKNTAGFAFLEAAPIVGPLVSELKAKGANVVIALTHQDFDDDKALARTVPGIDLVVAGHCHVALEKPEMVGRVPIVEAGVNGRYLGEVRLSVDPAQGARLLSYRLIDLCSPAVEPDPRIQAIVDRYLEPETKELSRVVADLGVELPRGLWGDASPMGQVLAEAMREQYGVPISLVPFGGVRRALGPGRVTVQHLYEVTPYGNTMAILEMEGKSIRTLIERGLSGTWKPLTEKLRPAAQAVAGSRRIREAFVPMTGVKGILVGSGLSYAFDPKRPAGQRLVSLTVGTEPLSDERVYKVVVSSYLADGGDGTVEFTRCRRRDDRPEKDRELLEKYLRKHPIRSLPEPSVRNTANVYETGAAAPAGTSPRASPSASSASGK